MQEDVTIYGLTTLSAEFKRSVLNQPTSAKFPIYNFGERRQSRNVNNEITLSLCIRNGQGGRIDGRFGGQTIAILRHQKVVIYFLSIICLVVNFSCLYYYY
jgi:hypothetical protein